MKVLETKSLVTSTEKKGGEKKKKKDHKSFHPITSKGSLTSTNSRSPRAGSEWLSQQEQLKLSSFLNLNDFQHCHWANQTKLHFWAQVIKQSWCCFFCFVFFCPFLYFFFIVLCLFLFIVFPLSLSYICKSPPTANWHLSRSCVFFFLFVLLFLNSQNINILYTLSNWQKRLRPVLCISFLFVFVCFVSVYVRRYALFHCRLTIHCRRVICQESHCRAYGE